MATNIFSHYFELNIRQDTNTILEVNGVDVDLGVSVDDNEWHNLCLTIQEDGSFDVYLDSSTTPISSSSPGIEGGGSQDLTIGGDGLSLFGLRCIHEAVNIEDYEINYLDKDITENNGNVFYEVV